MPKAPLTDEDRAVMSDREIEMYEQSQAGGEYDDPDDGPEGDRGGDKDDALDGSDIEAKVQAALEKAIADRAADRSAQANDDPPPPAATDDPYERLADLQFRDPVLYHREVVRLAREEAMRDLEAQVGPTIRRARATQVEDTLSEGLGAKGREYIRRYADMLTPEQASDPKVKDLMVRAARQFEVESAPRRDRAEGTRSETRTVRAEDRKAADFFAQIAAEASGVDIDRLRLKDEEMGVE